MKKLMLLCAALTAVALMAGPQKMAPEKGSRGARVLLFNGGRPWQGDEVTNFLVSGTLRVVDFNGAYLDGLAGATIKAHPTDRVEPVAFDGFTPAFQKLKPYRDAVIVFHQIPTQNYAKIFTPERVAQLKNYLQKGGNLVLTRPFPAGVIDELLPVVLGEDTTVGAAEILFANRPDGKLYRCMPEKIPVYGFYQMAQLRSGAEAISMIRDEKGNEVAPLIARIKVGKGSVTFFNAERRLQKQMLEFANWAYHRALMIAVIADSAKALGAHPENAVNRLEKAPERVQIGAVAVSAQLPQLGIADEKKEVVLLGNRATFGNGYVVDILPDGKVDVTAPGKKKPYLKNYGIPQIKYSEKQAVFDSATAEATEVKENFKAADIKWQLDKIETRGRELVLTYTAKDSLMRWIFKAGKLELDGRIFYGVGDYAEVEKTPFLVSQLEFSGELDLPDPLFAHRNDCYQVPRGYTAFDMTGKTTATTRFYTGQPFEMVVCKNALYIGNRSYPEFTHAQLDRQKGAPFITTKHTTHFGRIYAPLATHAYWHWFDDGTERAHNDYLAMYQYMRQMLRRQANLKELPPYPVAGYGYLSPDEAKHFAAEAVKLGFRYIYPPMPESPIEEIADDKNLAVYQMIKAAGGNAYIWTAGSYVQGDGGEIFQTHPEWFLKDEKGKVVQYFGTYPVIDLNAPGFYEFCIPIFEEAIKNGVKWFYRDMDGGAAGGVNFGTPTSPSGMPAQIRFYRFFHDRDCRVSVEGMNPLVLDEYWYRPELYTSFSGKEFALVGQAPNSGIAGALTLDHFRLAMYGCFPNWVPEGLIFGIERVPDEIVLSKRAAGFVPKFNAVLDHVGMPFIRETPFGSVWVSEKGGALFFWNPAQKVTVDLPQDWRIRGVAGNVLTDVKPDAIYFLEKK